MKLNGYFLIDTPFIHDQLCNNNLWYDNCRNNCKKLHIRRNGEKLKLFDMSLNLHRLDNKISPNTLDTLFFPRNCDFHIMDNMCDPESWLQPITSSKYTIHRILGIHPKYSAPEEFFQELTPLIQKLIDTQFFNAISTGIENHSNSMDCISQLYAKGQVKLPLYIHSRNDRETINLLNKEFFQTIPIIWQNTNLGLENRFENIVELQHNTTLQSYFETRENYFLGLNSLINSHRIHKLKNMITPELIERIIPTTDAPHNAFSQKNMNKAPYSEPIHIVRTIIQIHYQLINIKQFKNYNLYDTNDWLFNKSINIFPPTTTSSATQYKILAKKILSNTLEKWSRKIKYDKIPTQTIQHQHKPTNTRDKISTDQNTPKPKLKPNVLAPPTEQLTTPPTTLSTEKPEKILCEKCKNPIQTTSSAQTNSTNYPIRVPPTTIDVSTNTTNTFLNTNTSKPATSKLLTESSQQLLQLPDTTIMTDATNLQLLELDPHATEMAIELALSPRPVSTQTQYSNKNIESKENIHCLSEGSRTQPIKRRSASNTHNNVPLPKRQRADTATHQPKIMQSFKARTSLDDRLNNVPMKKPNEINNEDTDFLHFLNENFFETN